jgi:hypothetical protein
MTTLSHLSIQRVTGRIKPRVPSPAERMAAYNAARPVQFANTRFPAATGRDAPITFDPPAFDELPATYADHRGF